MCQRVLILVIALLIPSPGSGQGREMVLTVSEGLATAMLRFGLAPGATDGLDAALGEMEIPPPPPAGGFDARFTGIGYGEGIMTDLRHGDTATTGARIHEMTVRADAGRAITIGWDLRPDVRAELQDAATGVAMIGTMKDAGTCVLICRDVCTRMRLVVHYQPIFVRIRAFLQGPFNAATLRMNTLLRSTRVLAAQFGDGRAPSLAVDSITVEIRNAAASASATVRRYASAWLLADGTVRRFADTAAAELLFDSASAGTYYVVIRHRNHLAVMSGIGLALSASLTEHDFTTGQVRAYGLNPMKGLGPGGGAPFGLFAADGNASGAINAVDMNAVWRPQNGTSSCYLGGDFNLNGFVNATDYVVYWRVNNGVIGQVP